MTELRIKIMTNHITKLLEPVFGSICPGYINDLLKVDEVVSNFDKYYPFNIGMLEQGYSSSCADTGCLDPAALSEEYKNLILIPEYKKLKEQRIESLLSRFFKNIQFDRNQEK